VHTVFRRLSRLLGLAALVTTEIAVLVVLLRLGERAPFTIPFDHLDDWARATEPADAVAALVRVLALGAAGWLLLTTLLYVAARTASVPGALRAVEWATLPAIRRVVDRAVVIVAMGAFVTPAGAATVDVRDGHSGSATSTSTTRAPAAPAAPATVAPVAVAPRAPAPPSTAATSVVVSPGDNLWTIAAAQLAATSNRPRTALSDAEIARYWVAVCDANRARLRSRDLNLIHPGETILLPAST
jgi:hypothetical protein